MRGNIPHKSHAHTFDSDAVIEFTVRMRFATQNHTHLAPSEREWNPASFTQRYVIGYPNTALVFQMPCHTRIGDTESQCVGCDSQTSDSTVLKRKNRSPNIAQKQSLPSRQSESIGTQLCQDEHENIIVELLRRAQKGWRDRHDGRDERPASSHGLQVLISSFDRITIFCLISETERE